MRHGMANIDWVFELKSEVPAFLDRLKGNKKEGFFHYSLSGDLYTEDEHWGLGNAVFAAKIYYTLDMIDALPESEIDGIARFIKGFQKSDGSIYDPLIARKSSLLNILHAARHLDFSNALGQQTKRAETRQSFSCLQLLHSHPDLPYLQMPNTREEINKYLSRLDWTKPYGAGSHLSHLLFFLNINRTFFNTQQEATDDFIDYIIEWVNRLQSPEDGSWGLGSDISPLQKINGAMKIITGLAAAGKPVFKYPERLIDLCLSKANLDQACNSLDTIYVIHHADKLINNSYRYDDIKGFCYRWLNNCHEHYFPDAGGFSFYKHRANDNYYGARINRGLNEPDIHGTVLLLWGIAIVSQILGVDKELGFKEFIP